MKLPLWVREHRFFCILFILNFFLIFTRLDDIPLTTDESHNVILAKNIRMFGYPTAYDGKNFIIEQPLDINGKGIWLVHPWLPSYLTAFSFLVFGMSTFSARLPFALLGWFSTALFYCYALQLFKNKRVASLATVFLVLSVPVVLFIRASRYYALYLFASIWVFYAYVKFTRHEPWSNLHLILSQVVLFYSFSPAYFGIALCLLVLFLFDHLDLKKRQATYCFTFKNKEQVYQFFIIMVVVGLLITPWIFYAQLWRYQPRSDETLHNTYLSKLFINLRMLHAFIFPIIIPFFVALYLYFKKKHFKKFFIRSLCGILFGILIFILYTTIWAAHNLRYYLGIIPLLFLVLGYFLSFLWSRKFLFAGLLTFMIINPVYYFYNPSSNAVYGAHSPMYHSYLLYPVGRLQFEIAWLNVGFHVTSPLYSYLYELTHRHNDLLEGVILYLNEHAQPNETFMGSCTRFPIMVYTNLTVYPVSSPGALVPLWYPHWYRSPDSPYPDWYLAPPGLNDLAGYEKIVLPFHYSPNIFTFSLCENNHDITTHQFKAIAFGPPVVLYHKIKNSQPQNS